MNYIQEIRAIIGHRPMFMSGAVVLVQNEREEILLQHRTDSKDWGVPGGAMELGETFEQTASRELYEETGLACSHLELLTVMSGEEMYYRYPNGDEVYNITAVFRAVEVNGEIRIADDESIELRYFSRDKLPELHKMAKLILERVQW